MAMVVGVLEYIEDCIRDHVFGNYYSNFKHNLYKTILSRELSVVCSGGKVIEAPKDSVLVVYRPPRSTVARNIAIACFHYPDNDTYVVIYAGGKAAVRKVSNKTVYDYGVAPRIQSPSRVSES